MTPKYSSPSELAAAIRYLQERCDALEAELDKRERRTDPTPVDQDSALTRLEMLVESTGLAWWDQDFATGVVTRSANWAQMLGYSPEEIGPLLEPWKELIHPDDRPITEQAIQRHEAGLSAAFEVEHRMRTKDGVWKWILNWGRIVAWDPQGKPLRAVGTHLDITRRKQAELEKERLITNLEKAFNEIKTLRGIIPICANCKRIRDDGGYWNQIEAYIRDRSEAEFTHGICPDCEQRLYGSIFGRQLAKDNCD